MSDFNEKYQVFHEKVEKALLDCFDRKFDSPDNIVSAMKYSLFAGGKRIRPIMMLAVNECLHGNERDMIKLACAIEMVHTYSLIHDDLPSMDNDDMRRGKPTSHVVYGEDIAILAGDALLNFAVETALAGMPLESEKIFRYVKALQKLFYASGVNGMIGGQTGDLLCEGDAEVNEPKMMYVYTHKTGALFEAALLCGAIVAGASPQTLDAFKAYADAIGLAFQIVDDLLDIGGDERILGKPVGSDVKNEKVTFVSMYGAASAKVRIGELLEKALAALEGIDGDVSFFKEMAYFICDRAY